MEKERKENSKIQVMFQPEDNIFSEFANKFCTNCEKDCEEDEEIFLCILLKIYNLLKNLEYSVKLIR